MAALRWSGVWSALAVAALAPAAGCGIVWAQNLPPEIVLAVAGPPFDTTEAGGQVSLELRLSRRPRTDVTFQVRSTNELEATVEPRTVTVAAGGEDPPVPVRLAVTGVQDEVDDDDAPFAVEVVAVAGDPDFVALGARRVDLLNLDDDVAGVRVSPSVVFVRPGGSPASFTAALTSRPREGGVEVALASRRPDFATSVGLVFTGGASWQVPVVAAVTPATRTPATGSLASQLVFGPVWSGDPLYPTVAPDPVTIFQIGSQPGFSVAPTHGLATTEDGGTASFYVALNTRPAQAVTLSLASSNPGEGTVSPATLAFTPADWDQVRTVTVTGRDDGPARYKVAIASSAGGDATAVELVNLPSAISAAKASQGEIVILAPEAGLTVREGEGAVFSVVLSRPPAAEVWVYVHSDRPDVGTVEPAAVCFSPRTWSTPRPLVVRGAFGMGGLPAKRSFRVVTDLTWSRDSGFRGLDPADLQVSVLADTTAGSFFTVVPCRLYDSRQAVPGGEPLRSGQDRVLTVRGRCGVPPEARAVAVNLTAVSPSGAGSLTLYPADQSLPMASAISFAAGELRANSGLFLLSADGRLALRPTVAGSGTLQVVIDVAGYFQ